MFSTPVYLDNHATTRVDPRVIDAMLPYFGERYGNAGSVSHEFGRECQTAVEQARAAIAAAVGAQPREIIFTSGATESNNLAIRGLVERNTRPGAHIVSVQTEHRAVLAPLHRLARRGVRVTTLPVAQAGSPHAGCVDVDQLADAITQDTILVSVMLANNEVGTIQRLSEIGRLCRERGVILHSDATQAVGHIGVDVRQLEVDLLSFSAHKFYGPKGIGALFVRREGRRLRLASQVDGGGQEGNLRSGTLNVPGIVGMARALELCVEEMPTEGPRVRTLRDRLHDGLCRAIADVRLNGPALDDPAVRLPGNLNCSFAQVDGQAVMLHAPDVVCSSSSACTSISPEPSHVLLALGLDVGQVRSSLRFGVGRFNTAEEIDFAVEHIAQAVTRLRSLHGPR